MILIKLSLAFLLSQTLLRPLPSKSKVQFPERKYVIGELTSSAT